MIRQFGGIFSINNDTDNSFMKTPSQAITHDHFMNVVNANYGHFIKRAYAYVKCTSLAEDVVQEGILTAYKKLDTVRDRDALKSWVNRIIINKALDSLRKNNRILVFYGDIDEVVSYCNSGLLNAPLWAESSTPEQDIIKKENLQKLTQHIEELEDIYRIPLLLKDHEGFSIKEISEILNISESNAKIRIHRARIKVKLKLGKYFYPYQNKGQL